MFRSNVSVTVTTSQPVVVEFWLFAMLLTSIGHCDNYSLEVRLTIGRAAMIVVL